MKLNKLITCSYETEITGIKIDSREVKKGDLFIAVKGFNIDHNLYIDDAIKRGAVAVISERNWKKRYYNFAKISYRKYQRYFKHNFKLCYWKVW